MERTFLLALGLTIAGLRPLDVCGPATLSDPKTRFEASQSAGPGQRKGRLFPPLDLGLLDAPDRDQWQKPDQIMDALKIADGSVVADLGAGGGWFTIRLARRVGPNGLVFAEDIQPQMIEAITRRARAEGLANVRPVLGTPTDPRLPRGIDAVLIVDTYREMDDPRDPTQVRTLLKNVARSLKPQGRVGVVDFTMTGGGPGPSPEERVDAETITKAARDASLQLVAREIVPPFQFLLVFGRSSEAAPQNRLVRSSGRSFARPPSSQPRYAGASRACRSRQIRTHLDRASTASEAAPQNRLVRSSGRSFARPPSSQPR